MSGNKRVSHEPIVWFPFSAGGMLAAILVPVHIVVFFVAAPLGLIEEPSGGWLHRLVTHPIGRVYLFVLVAGCLFHFAHRFRYVLIDLGLHGGRSAVAALCYGSAVAGSAWAAVVFFG
jgi:fumarate reductase subunit D